MKHLLFDFSRVLLFPKDTSYNGSLNKLYKNIQQDNEKFFDYFVVNQELLDYLETLEQKKYIYTTGTVQNAPEIIQDLNKVFIKIFNVPQIGFAKDDQQSYQKICQIININPVNLMFIDDTKPNLVAAQKIGVHTCHYSSNQHTIEEINNWLKNNE